MKKFIGTALTSALLFTGGCGTFWPEKRYQEEDVPTAAVEVSLERQQYLQGIHNKLREYWGENLNANLFVVQGNDEVLCEWEEDGTRELVTARMLPMYCKYPGAVALTGMFLNISNPEWSGNDPAMQKAGEVVAIVHEGSHNIQHLLGALSNGEDPAITRGEERQADCYTGRYIGRSGHYSQEFLRIAAEYMLKIPASPVHPSPNERRAAVLAGAAGEPC